ncbi:putative secreted protein [Gottschalkia purinilytica]|uniref:Putative secreted protein n=1 Tax=Gottschalkia purinilytica TaxID=1503 RepID=A0A0L0W8D7_GOTPU|nr:CD3072 family TudS-related putative desulfidase [Gottschalkia purinilytica]KNF07530.1 putative secreted protein [Gottschalkia purinilytica]
MKKEKRIVLLSHCILNINSKVEGLDEYPSHINNLLKYFIDNNIGMLQLPCPETIVYGIKRWGHVKEQFNTQFFRKQCKEMLEPIVYQVSDYINNGYEIVGVIGIDGSPSCGVNKTCSGNWGGEFIDIDDTKKKIENLVMIEEKGVYIEVLEELLNLHKINIPFYAVDESNGEKSILELISILSKNISL